MNYGEIKMPFGNYKGKTLEMIYRIDQQYLLWARDHLKGDLRAQIAEFIHQKNEQILGRKKP